ncbi:MAG: sugar phosphate isomerase/epimerase [Phycisphaerales bacterium]|nr:sugar phosphate isomerase/epimerase [Phycisphaerales bacterium]
MSSSRALSAWLDYYRVPLRDALDCCRSDGFRLIVPNTAAPELDPVAMGRTARRHLAKHLQSIGLRIPSLATEFSGNGLADSTYSDRRLDHLRSALELARDLSASRASVRIAGLADERSSSLANEMLAHAAELSDRTGIILSVHGSTRDTKPLIQQIRQLNCPTLRLALDTAAVCATSQTGLGSIDCLGELFLRDGRLHGDHFEETAFGSGEVDFAQVLSAAESSEVETVAVIRRDTPSGVDALRRGREYISSVLGHKT